MSKLLVFALISSTVNVPADRGKTCYQVKSQSNKIQTIAQQYYSNRLKVSLPIELLKSLRTSERKINSNDLKIALDNLMKHRNDKDAIDYTAPVSRYMDEWLQQNC